ncbi:MAG: hypothetical protein GOP50_12155 [Candidatus Heimdallarchaeota archaeon]|nr:hypothetical protein [Candidatus Heimdallarchaeota archaeon]
MFNITTEYIGVNIGSVSVNLVSLDEKGKASIAKHPHLGKPEEVLEKMIKEQVSSEKRFFDVSGSFGEISEIVAIEKGISSYDEKFDIVVSLGGESFVLYVLDEKGYIVNVLSHDKCAAGSGEFFIQQIDRLDVTLSEAIDLAKKGKKIELASRCSVHCKSDVTHKLNRGEASIEDILTSVLASMVSKVMGLITQSRVELKRLLLIGGISLNDAFVKLLREELDGVEVVIKDVSSVFEAYGTALIVQESPLHDNYKLITTKTFTQLPSLEQFSDQVTIIEAKENKKDFDKNLSLILGVDVGSTTTKAILLDPVDNAVVASYYGRTSGNPVEATKKCIQELIDQAGNCKVNLVGVTGSGRQIVGAYLGTSAVYNEISAHSKGAVYYDEEVDTIFEIGGQDSKYMFLQNGVPVDYAMNASCSAGTGSFLEESSKGDLGIHVFDISDVAMKADSPVRFKADCAAFINTDIRTAAQEGYEPDNIVGGLVYSIADNYLNKVKGLRPVGQKIFFQGGVAKNNAVGYAFAQATGKKIIIPPNPELIGAFGISLIAKSKYEQHEIIGMSEHTSLESLIKEKMKHSGSFTCKACKNYCQIERYEVGGRKFPFGGRCSRYEHQWRGSDKTEEKEDLVLIRNDLLFGINSGTEKKKPTHNERIGIPRALLTHSLYPLYSTFFEELGYEIILSGIDDDKELMTNASFCYPVQILHGAVLDLVKNKVTTVFLPHVHSGTTGKDWRDSTFCPLTQASPYFISQAFKELEFLSPVLDFRQGYENNNALVKMAVEKLDIPKNIANKAYHKAITAQKQIEDKFLEKGKETLDKLRDSGEIGILLVGRSYNAFPPETSQLIPKKLASMGVTVIPFDFLGKDSAEDFPWFFANYAQKALELAQEYDNLFILYINSFSCTIDAFVQNHMRNEMKSKPYLILELDAHSADAGIQTRLEAFLEIIKNFQVTKKKTEVKPFQITKVKKRSGKIVVITSDNKKLDIRDPRVKLHFFPFSQYHTDTMSKIFDLFGFHSGETTEMKIEYPVEGLRYTSGKECIPLPIIIGHMLSIIENRKPGEAVGFFMIRGGSPCAVYSYFNYLLHFIEKNEFKDVFLFRFDQLTDFLGIDRITIAKYVPATALVGDLMVEIDSALQVVGHNGSRQLLQDYWSEFLSCTTELKQFHKNVEKLIDKISTIPRKESPKNLPKVLITGDFFVRYSPFFLNELKELYAKHNILVKSSDLYEVSLYSNINLRLIVAQDWRKEPNKVSTALRAFATFWTRSSQLYIISLLAPPLMHAIEKRYRRKFKKTGLLFAGRNNLREINKQSKPLISPLIFGEAIPTIGKGMETLENSDYDSLILTGPINCLPYKIAQAILKPIYLEHGVPFLVFDVDTSAITPNMKRLINANIEQIKRRQN